MQKISNLYKPHVNLVHTNRAQLYGSINYSEDYIKLTCANQVRVASFFSGLTRVSENNYMYHSN